MYQEELLLGIEDPVVRDLEPIRVATCG